MLIIAAGVFQFALIGYTFSVMACLGFAAVLLLYELFARRGWRRMVKYIP